MNDQLKKIQELAARFAEVLADAPSHGLTWQDALFAVGLAINGTAKGIAKQDNAAPAEVLASGMPFLERALAVQFADDEPVRPH